MKMNYFLNKSNNYIFRSFGNNCLVEKKIKFEKIHINDPNFPINKKDLNNIIKKKNILYFLKLKNIGYYLKNSI